MEQYVFAVIFESESINREILFVLAHDYESACATGELLFMHLKGMNKEDYIKNRFDITVSLAEPKGGQEWSL